MTDPLRPKGTDEEPTPIRGRGWPDEFYELDPLLPDRSPIVILALLAALSGFLVGVVVMGAAR